MGSTSALFMLRASTIRGVYQGHHSAQPMSYGLRSRYVIGNHAVLAANFPITQLERAERHCAAAALVAPGSQEHRSSASDLVPMSIVVDLAPQSYRSPDAGEWFYSPAVRTRMPAMAGRRRRCGSRSHMGDAHGYHPW